ncbi:MAG: DNA-processing protein DprA, partial [Lentihominibacter sp.]
MKGETGRITSGMPEYPAILKEIRGYPRELFYRGNIDLINRRCAAVVGSRKTTQYGRTISKNISGALAERNIVVVSGMAKGIDACAHRGALDVSGGTIAVLGNGVDVCYPEENRQLKEEIERNGLILSEYPPGRKPEKYYFPQRNRIISGLSELTVVVQAGGSSGALITAELAAEQGRDVFAVPGNIDSRYNLGNNKLIKEGAVPVTCIQDILD